MGYSDDLLSTLPVPPDTAAYSDELLNAPVAKPQSPDAPIQKFMGGTSPDIVVDEPSEAAGAGTQAVASLPTDIGARVRYYASQRFPDAPVDEAVQRYGMKDGRLYYVDDDGNATFEESEARLPKSVSDIDEAMLSTGKAMAGSTGPAIPVITGTVAGIATTPVGGGVPGAAVGGAVGDVARQGLAHVLTGEEKPLTERLTQTGTAALQEGAGQAGGVGVAKGLGRFGRTPTYDIPSSKRLAEGSERFDIPLTAGEATGAKTLIRRQKILGATTEGEQVFEEFYRFRNSKVRDAVADILERIAPDRSVRAGTKFGVEGAQAAVDVERKALARQARPLYEQAYEVDIVDTRPVIDLIDGKIETASAPVRQKLLRVRRDLMRMAKRKVDGETIEEAVPENRLAKIDNIKKWLDDEINAAGRSDQALGKSQKFHLEEVRKLLVEQADEADQAVTGGAYAKARGIYEAGIPASTELTKGVVGDVAKLQANDVLRATRILFNPRTSSPLDVSVARKAFAKAGKTNEWNALVRAHIEDVFEDIPESAFGDVTNLGGTLFRKVFGTPKKVSMLQEALADSPATMGDLRWMMEVLAATGRAAKGESITAFAQAGQRELARESKPLGAAAVETIELWRTPSRIAQFWSNVAEGRYARKMSEILTSPEGVAKLKELRRLSPKSAGAVVAFSHLLTGVGVARAGETPDVPPGGFSTTADRPEAQPAR